ncbi:MAG TPA: hypothetical protein VD846_05055 [Allosphingosinicella sp.]|nr:hypothetical protein [Allosphingosinicella sp.]
MVVKPLFALAAAAAALTGAAQPEPAPIAAASPAALGEAVVGFLRDAARVRAALRLSGGKKRANAFWESANRFAAAVGDAAPSDKPLFLPIVAGFRTAMAESTASPGRTDLATLAAVQRAMDDQTRVQTAPGASARKAGIKVNLSGMRKGSSVKGLYAWMDLTCCVPKKGSANAVPGGTPTSTVVAPGDYRIRLLNGNQVVGTRIATIGKLKPGTVENVVVQIP